VTDNKKNKKNWKTFSEGTQKVETPSWVTTDLKDLSIKVTSAPAGEELKHVFDPKLIVEFYSR